MDDILLTDCYVRRSRAAVASDIESERDGEMVWDDMD